MSRQLKLSEVRLQAAQDWAEYQPHYAWIEFPILYDQDPDVIYAIQTVTGRVLVGKKSVWTARTMQWIEEQPQYDSPIYWIQVPSDVLSNTAK